MIAPTKMYKEPTPKTVKSKLNIVTIINNDISLLWKVMTTVRAYFQRYSRTSFSWHHQLSKLWLNMWCCQILNV